LKEHVMAFVALPPMGKQKSTSLARVGVGQFGLSTVAYISLHAKAAEHLKVNAKDRVALSVGHGEDIGKLKLVKADSGFSLQKYGLRTRLLVATSRVPWLVQTPAKPRDCHVELNGNGELYVTIPEEMVQPKK
jgi:hypothetical protein